MKKLLLGAALLFGVLLYFALPKAAWTEKSDNPDTMVQEQACQFVAAPPETLRNEGIRAFTLHQGWMDANNDGKIDEVRMEESGTAHNKSFAIFSLSGRESPDVFEITAQHSPDTYNKFKEIGWSKDLQWLPFKGYTFLLELSDYPGTFPRNLWYITPEYQAVHACAFSTKRELLSVRPTTGASVYSWAPDVCQKVATQKIETYIQPTKEELSFGNETTGHGYIEVDINNDGKTEKLHFAEYASGRGAGCDANFAVLEGDQGFIKQQTTEGLSPFSQLLYEAQQVDFSNGGPIASCATKTQPRVFLYNDHTFLEIVPSKEPIDSKEELLHEVWLFLPDKAVNVCGINYAVKTNFQIQNKEQEAKISLRVLQFKEITAKEVRNILKGINIPDKIDPRNPDMADMSKPPKEWLIPSYSIAQHDLNDDGEEEIFLYRAGSGMCGSAGCQMSLYQRQGNGTYLAVQGWTVYQDIKIYEDKHSGYHNIGFALRWPVDGANHNVLRWNGQKYIPTLSADYKVDFSYTEYPEERAKIYEMFKKDFERAHEVRKEMKLPSQESSIGVDQYDLNNDGIKEIFSFIQSTYFCGASRCKMMVFQATDNDLKPLLDVYVNDVVTVSSTTSKGFKDIRIGSGVTDNQLNLWRWNGKQYVHSGKTL